MRANLLASATVTSQAGRGSETLARPDRKRIGAVVEPSKARGRPEHEQSSQIAIALFGNPAEPVLSAARVLSGNEAEPGRKAAS